MKPKEVGFELLIWQRTERLPLQKTVEATAPCIIIIFLNTLYLELLTYKNMERVEPGGEETCIHVQRHRLSNRVTVSSLPI